jgi:16S rRNA (uracil1498-N3)-methyltransferase
MHLFYSPAMNDEHGFLGEEESRHCIRVMRLAAEDPVHVTDGLGNLYECVIQSADPKKCVVRVVSVQHDHGKRKTRLHIAIAPTKNMDRIEWFLEKATEIGIDEVTPFFSIHSERIRVKQERLEKVLIAAMKQSLKAYLPKLNEPADYRKFIEKEFPGQKFIAWCETGKEEELQKVYQKGSDVLILIGPEGDFSPDETSAAVRNGFKPVSLGESRLRTETAGLVACHTINLMNRR